MRKIPLLISLLFLLISIDIQADNISLIIDQIKSQEKELKKINSKEKKLQSAITKIEGKNDIISKGKKVRYLNKLNKIQNKKVEIIKNKKEKIARLKIILTDKIALYEKRIIETSNDKIEEILSMQEEFLRLKKLYNFYFIEKIDIIINKDEPQDVIEKKMDVIREKITYFSNEVKKTEMMITTMQEQTTFIKNSNYHLPDEENFNNDYIEFIERVILYLKVDIEKKNNIINLYKNQLKYFRGGKGNEKN